MTTQTEKRPRVRATVILLILAGLYGLYVGYDGLTLLNSTSPALLPGWFPPLVYFALILGIAQLVAAFLVATYKRAGLILTLILVGIGLATTAWQVLQGTTALNLGTIIGVLINLAIAYYMYQYLTSEPEKSFFT